MTGTDFVPCVNSDACPGTVNTTDSSVCALGHQGTMCSVCASGYGADQWNKYACVECGNNAVIIVFGILFVACVVLMLLWVVRSTLRTDPFESSLQSSKHGTDERVNFVALIKLLINHV